MNVPYTVFVCDTGKPRKDWQNTLSEEFVTLRGWVVDAFLDSEGREVRGPGVVLMHSDPGEAVLGDISKYAVNNRLFVITVSGAPRSGAECGRFSGRVYRRRAAIVSVDRAFGRQVREFLARLDERKEAPFDILEPRTPLIDPFLPLGVLLDGYLECRDAEVAALAEWFSSGLDVARSVDSPSYWDELLACTSEVERLELLLADQSATTEGVRGVFERARARARTGDAADIYRWACGAIRQILEVLTEEAPRREGFRQLVEDASDGFHVLAAGHL